MGLGAVGTQDQSLRTGAPHGGKKPERVEFR